MIGRIAVIVGVFAAALYHIFHGAVKPTTVWQSTVPVPTLTAFEDASIGDVFQEGKPIVLKGYVKKWPACEKWKDLDYVKRNMVLDNKGLRAHLPKSETVQLMSLVGQSFADGPVDAVKWHKPWKEDVLSGPLLNEFFDVKNKSSRRLMYVMVPGGDVPDVLASEVGSVQELIPAWMKREQVNLWMATAPVKSPLHYDLTSNSYVQIRGRKRFLLLPQSNASALYLYPKLHPSARQSQVNVLFDANKEGEVGFKYKFPIPKQKSPETKPNGAVDSELGDQFELKPMEVVLEPGDVLFIPGYYFHHVGAVDDDDMSISLSVSWENDYLPIREEILDIFPPGLPQDAELEDAVVALTLYVANLAPINKDPVVFIRQLLEQRYAPLQYDTETADGLWQWLSYGSNENVDLLVQFVRDSTLQLDEAMAWVSTARKVRHKTTGFHDQSIQQLELFNYIEDVVNHVLGPTRVLPFFQRFEQYFQIVSEKYS